MCGIAGYSVGIESQIDRTLATQALLAGIAERGADAVGYAVRGDGPLTVHKQQTGASAMLDDDRRPRRRPVRRSSTCATTRRGIRRSPRTTTPSATGVVGIHNGIISNDEELFVGHDIERHEPEMTVDSEAIFALVDAVRHADRCARAPRRRDGGRLDRRARARLSSTSRAASGARSGSARTTRGALRLDARRARGRRERRSERRSARPRSTRAGSCRSWTASSSRSGAGAPTGATARTAAAGRPRPARGPLVPRSPVGDRSARDRLGRQRPVGLDVDALLAQPLTDEELERRPGAGLNVDHAVDLPLGEQRRVRAARASFQSAILGRCPSSRASTAPSATARSSRSSPTGTSNPASRSAADSDPKVCQISDFEAIRPRRSSRSRAVGMRPSSAPSSRS